jgi:DNA helicase-2/ATP-dependent DNA helicase PcrA
MLVKCYNLLSQNPAVLRIWRQKYTYILVDEFQDINQAQYQCVSLLAGEAQNLFIVGDDDQSIYRFRGARPEFLLHFPQDFPNTATVVLDTNYRSTDQIIKCCNAVISRNQMRYSKVMIGTGRSGPTPVLFQTEDANAEAAEVMKRVNKLRRRGAKLSDIAVIYRTNIQSRALADACMTMNIPYQVKDEAPSIYEHWIARDFYAYLKLSQDRGAEECLARIINKPKRYISNAAIAAAKKADGSIIDNLYMQKQLKVWQLARIEELMYNLNSISAQPPREAVKYIRQNVGYNEYLNEYAQYRKVSPKGMMEIADEVQEAAGPFQTAGEFITHMDTAVAEAKNQKIQRRRGGHTQNTTIADSLLLSTMHSVKGLEFETVFLVGAVEGSIPHEKSKTEAEIEEERRLFYVGLTRAKTNLFLSVMKKRHEEAVQVTRFLEPLLPKKKRA